MITLTRREKVMLAIIIMLLLALSSTLFFTFSLIERYEKKASYESEQKQVIERKVTVWTYWEEKEALDALREITRGYASKTGINVTVTCVPLDEYKYKLFRDLQHGEGPDVFIAPHEWLSELVAAGVIAPIDYSEIAEEYPASIISAVTWESEIYAIPVKIEVPALIVNTKLVETPPEALEDIVKNKASLESGAHVLVYPVDNAFLSSGWFYAVDAYYFDFKTGDTRINCTEGREVLHLLVELATTMPDNITMSGMIEVFTKGGAGMVIGTPSILPLLRNRMESLNDLVVTPLPKCLGKRAKPLMTLDVIYVSRLAEKRKLKSLAISLAKHIATEGSLTLLKKAHLVVTWGKAYSDTHTATSKILKGFYEQSMHATPMPPTDKMSRIILVVTKYLKLAIRGQLSCDEALDECASEIKRLKT